MVQNNDNKFIFKRYSEKQLAVIQWKIMAAELL